MKPVFIVAPVTVLALSCSGGATVDNQAAASDAGAWDTGDACAERGAFDATRQQRISELESAVSAALWWEHYWFGAWEQRWKDGDDKRLLFAWVRPDQFDPSLTQVLIDSWLSTLTLSVEEGSGYVLRGSLDYDDPNTDRRQNEEAYAAIRGRAKEAHPITIEFVRDPPLDLAIFDEKKARRALRIVRQALVCGGGDASDYNTLRDGQRLNVGNFDLAYPWLYYHIEGSDYLGVVEWLPDSGAVSRVEALLADGSRNGRRARHALSVMRKNRVGLICRGMEIVPE